MQINWSEGSTRRGAVWLIAFVIGLVLLFTGQADNVDKLILLATGVAGGLGVLQSDKV